MTLSKRNSALALAALIGIFVLSILVDVETLSRIPLCFFKHLTQLDCPGCGLTRSFISLSHGHFIEAIRYNALGPLIYLYLLLYLSGHLSNLILPKGFGFSWQLSKFAKYSFFVLFIGQWLFKLAKQIPQIIS